MDAQEFENQHYGLNYGVYDVSYIFGTGSNEPHIGFWLKDLKIGDRDNRSYASTPSGSGRVHADVHFVMNKLTFNNHTGLSWDGGEKDFERVKSRLEGKTFTLNLGIQEKIKEAISARSR